jgi:hypothetical protein
MDVSTIARISWGCSGVFIGSDGPETLGVVM